MQASKQTDNIFLIIDGKKEIICFTKIVGNYCDMPGWVFNSMVGYKSGQSNNSSYTKEENFTGFLRESTLKKLASAKSVGIQIYQDYYSLPPEAVEKLRQFSISVDQAIQTPFPETPIIKSPFAQ